MSYNRGKPKNKKPILDPKLIYKSDGKSRVMVLDKNYNFLRWATEEEAKVF